MLTMTPESNQAREAIVRAELKALTEEITSMNRFRAYYEGDQTLVYSTELFKAVFGTAFVGFKDNWCKVVVNATRDRLKVINFSIDDDTDDVMSKDIWKVLRRNNMAVQQKDLHEGTLVEGRSFVIVWPDEVRGAKVDWQPGQLCRVFYDPDERDLALWAVKRWTNETGDIFVTFYTPQAVFKFKETSTPTGIKNATSSSALTEIPGVGAFGGGLEERRIEGEEWPLPNPFGIVPVVEFNNTSYQSELVDTIPQQDALNKTLLDMMIAGEFAAFPQRVVETMANEPEGGWVSGPGEIWQFRPSFDADGKHIPAQFETFPTADPTQYMQPIAMWLQHMALTSSTPVRYFQTADRGGRGDAPSGDSLLVDDKPLNDKVEDKQDRLGASWWKVAQFISFSLGNTNAFELDGETVWRDPRHDYRLARLEEGKTMVEMGLPIKFVVKQIGLTPSEEVEVLAMIEEDEAKAEEDAAQLAEQQAEAAQSSTQTSESSDTSAQ